MSDMLSKNILLYGVGSNDADYNVARHMGGKQDLCPFYLRWKDMLRRCYDEDFHARQSSYADCSVCEEWHDFMTFRGWMDSQEWKSKDLDKDLKGCGKIYSPETCLFIPKWLNLLLMSRANTGVRLCKSGNYQARARYMGKNKTLGTFSSEEEAKNTCNSFKLKHHVQKVLDATDIDDTIKGLAINRFRSIFNA